MQSNLRFTFLLKSTEAPTVMLLLEPMRSPKRTGRATCPVVAFSTTIARPRDTLLQVDIVAGDAELHPQLSALGMDFVLLSDSLAENENDQKGRNIPSRKPTCTQYRILRKEEQVRERTILFCFIACFQFDFVNTLGMGTV
eukprot:902372-Prorocentrum_minimum.AAC.3